MIILSQGVVDEESVVVSALQGLYTMVTDALNFIMAHAVTKYMFVASLIYIAFQIVYYAVHTTRNP